MTMGFKYQMLACRYPQALEPSHATRAASSHSPPTPGRDARQELVLVTLNHLHEIRKKVLRSEAVTELVDCAIRAVYDKYLAMSSAGFASLKQAGSTAPATPASPEPLIPCHRPPAVSVRLLRRQVGQGVALPAGGDPDRGRHNCHLAERASPALSRYARDHNLLGRLGRGERVRKLSVPGKHAASAQPCR